MSQTLRHKTFRYKGSVTSRGCYPGQETVTADSKPENPSTPRSRGSTPTPLRACSLRSTPPRAYVFLLTVRERERLVHRELGWLVTQRRQRVEYVYDRGRYLLRLLRAVLLGEATLKQPRRRAPVLGLPCARGDAYAIAGSWRNGLCLLGACGVDGTQGG